MEVEDIKSTDEEAIGWNVLYNCSPCSWWHVALRGGEIRERNPWGSEFLEEFGRIRLSCGCELIHQNSEQTLETLTVLEKRF